LSTIPNVLLTYSSDWNTSSEVRARALQVILTLNATSHTKFADALSNALLQKELETNGPKSRSFAMSPVHLNRTRVLQTLLVLEPLISKVGDVVEGQGGIWP